MHRGQDAGPASGAGMINTQTLAAIRREIHQNQHFIITTHVNPDGDGLGSQVALARYLRSAAGGNKTVHLLNSSPLPSNYVFLDPRGEIEVFGASRHSAIVHNAQAIFILDISDWERLRELGKVVQPLPMRKICIDHHPHTQPFADIDVIYPEASSTGEIMFELLTGLGGSVDQKTAEALYTAILTDTGSFRFSNTTARSHQVIARLIDAGALPPLIYQRVYESQRRERVRLFAKALDKLRYEAGGKLAWFVISQAMMRETGGQPRDTESFPEYPRSIEGVEVSIMFLETETGRVKVSFRSKGRYVINGLANRFGGGGHLYAAGALMDGPLEQAIKAVLEEAVNLFK